MPRRASSSRSSSSSTSARAAAAIAATSACRRRRSAATMTTSGEPSVSISDHESAADRDDEEQGARGDQAAALRGADARARSAVSRPARSPNGKLILQRGSIGRVLPASLTAAMALGRHEANVWAGASSTHAMRRVPPPARRRALAAAIRHAERLNDHEPICASARTSGSGRFALRQPSGHPIQFRRFKEPR